MMCEYLWLLYCYQLKIYNCKYILFWSMLKFLAPPVYLVRIPLTLVLHQNSTQEGRTQHRRVGQDHVHHHLYDIMQSCFTAFLCGRRLLCTFNVSWRVSSMKRLQTSFLKSLYSLLCACSKQLCMWPCSLTKNVSECRSAQVFSIR